MIRAEHYPRHRANVAAIILNEQGQIFLAERVDALGSWQIPQGGIKSKKGEDPEQALWRELAEELGLMSPQRVLTVLCRHPSWLAYDFPKWLRQKGGKFARYQGQVQRYYLLRYSGSDDKITLEQNGQKEFSRFRWADPEEISSSVAPFKKEVMDQALAYFKENCPDFFG